jgi:hypothetical protein
MAVAATSTDLRESLIAQRIARVQPLPVDVCQWIASESPAAPQARVALLGELAERISAANPRPYPYLAICTIASTLPYYRTTSVEEQSQRLPHTLNTLCSLLALSQLRVVIEEEWKVLTEAAQQQAWLPTYFASEYLTVDFPMWCRELVDRSLALLGERGSSLESDLNPEYDGSDWEKNFRDAELLLLSPGNSFGQELCLDLSSNQRSALLALVERAKAAMCSEHRFELNRENPNGDKVVAKEEPRIIANSALADSLRGSSQALPKLPASATHPAIEEYFPAFDDNELRLRLDSILNEARNLEVPVNLVVIRELKPVESTAARIDGDLEMQNSPSRVWLEQVCNELSETHDECEFSKLLSVRSGELIYVQGGGDRLKLMPWIRTVLDGSAASLSNEMVSLDVDQGQAPNGLVAGLASVGRPNKSFRSTALLQAALRCLEAAQRQGAGAIKSIEVF